MEIARREMIGRLEPFAEPLWGWGASASVAAQEPSARGRSRRVAPARKRAFLSSSIRPPRHFDGSGLQACPVAAACISKPSA